MMENNTAAAEEVVESAATAEAAVAVKPKRHINQQKLQDNLWGWIFCLPLIVGTVLFIYIALIMAVLVSFTVYSSTLHGNVFDFLGTMFTGGEINYDGDLLNVFSDQVQNAAGDWVPRTDALRWYKYIFTNVESSCADAAQLGLEMSTMGMTLFNTVFYMIGIPIGMVLSMFFAVCMSRDIKGANFFRVLYYLPSVASTVAVVFTFNKLFTDSGVINSLLGSRIPWFNTGDGEPLLGAEAGIDPFWQQGLLNKTMVVIMMVWRASAVRLFCTLQAFLASTPPPRKRRRSTVQAAGRSSGRSPCPICTPSSSTTSSRRSSAACRSMQSPNCSSRPRATITWACPTCLRPGMSRSSGSGDAILPPRLARTSST